MSKTIVLIDDDGAVLASLEALFSTAGYDVRAFKTAGGFLDAVDSLPPACIVTDLRMPDIDGLTLIRRLKTELRLDWPIIVISGHADVAQAVETMRAGALDFLVKPFPPPRILEVVGQALLSIPAVGAAELSTVDARYLSLTEREKQVVEWLIAGAGSKGTGLALGISPRTVDIFRGKIGKKMGVANIAALSTAIASVSGHLRCSKEP